MAKNYVQLTEKNLSELPQMLWDLRTASGITQDEIAAKMNKLQSYISQIENKDKVKIPQLKTLLPYLKVIGHRIIIVPDGCKVQIVKDAE
jgi:transcriptional regulator with XRE-family HTH domain